MPSGRSSLLKRCDQHIPSLLILRNWVILAGWARKASRRYPCWGRSRGCCDNFTSTGQSWRCICCVQKNWDEQDDCTVAGWESERDIRSYERRKCVAEYSYYAVLSVVASIYPVINAWIALHPYDDDMMWFDLCMFVPRQCVWCIIHRRLPKDIGRLNPPFWLNLGVRPTQFHWLSLSLSSVISSLCSFLFLSVRFISLSLLSSILCVNYLLYRTISFSPSLPVVNFPVVSIPCRSALSSTN